MRRCSSVLMVFVAAVAMWVTAGCGLRAIDLMDRADALLDDRPDSAKVLLAQINPDRFLCPGRRARYTVLATTGRERTSRVSGSSEKNHHDTLLYNALDWFEKHPDRRPRDYMRALYYYGYRLFELKDSFSAIYYLTQAQQLAENLNEAFYSGMAYREIGAAYILSFNYPAAIENELKALEAFNSAGRPLHAASAKEEMARAYYYSGDYMQAQALCEQVCEVYQDSVLRAENLVILADSILRLSPDNADRSIQLINESVSLGKPLWMDALGVLAEAYAIKGLYKKTDDALRKLEQLANTEVRKNNLRFYQSRVALAKGDYRTAYELEQVFQRGNEHLNFKGQSESILNVQRDYFRILAKETRSKLYAFRRNSLLVLLAIFGVLFYAVYQIRKLIIERKKLKDAYQTSLSQASISNDTRRNLVLSFSRVLSSMHDGHSAYVNKQAYEFISDFSKGIYNSQLEILANAANQDAVKRLRDACQNKPDWTEEDFQLYALFLTGMTDSAISVIFRNKQGHTVSVNAIYTRKNRLKKKLEESFPQQDFSKFLHK